MRISTISQAFQAEFRKTEGIKKNERDQKVKAPVVDRSEISAGARRLNETKAQIEVLSAQVASHPDIRSDKVAEVQEKIKNGYYNSPEFIDKLADKLLKEFGITEANT